MSTAAVLSDFFTAALREARSERPASLASRIPALDELTEGGFPVNALTELFIPHAGIGEVRMLLPALASLKHVTWVLPCDSEAAPYAPALAELRLMLRPGRSGTVHVRATRRGAFFDRTREADVSLEERPLVPAPRACRRKVQQALASARLSPAC